MTFRKLLLAVAAGTCALLAISPGVASADLFFGGPGEGAGQLSRPEGVGVDQASGNVFVADRENNRVDAFTTTGTFLFAFGYGVANGAGAPQSCTVTCHAGIAGGGSGQLDFVTDLAVDNDSLSPSFHDVFVAERDNFRVQRFSAAGKFILMMGPGVNKSNGGDVCTAASGDLCGPGVPTPTLPTLPVLLHMVVGPGGTIYVAESDPIANPPAGLVYETQLRTFTSAGAEIGTVPVEGTRAPRSIVVDASGNFYVGFEGTAGLAKKFSPAGTLLAEYPGVGATLALDAGNNLFGAESLPQPKGGSAVTGSVITQYSPGGAIVRRFGYDALKELGGIATHSTVDGDIFATETAPLDAPESNRVVYLSLPTLGPVAPGGCIAKPIGNTAATLNGFVNPEGKATTHHFEYVDQATFEAEGFDNPESTAESAPSAADFELHAVSAQPALTPETTYHCRVVATNADDEGISDEGVFETLPPFAITATWADSVGKETATLNASVNPFGIAATGFFEYVGLASFEVSEFDEAVRVPDPESEAPLDFGAGESPVTRSVELAGLEANTRYVYRVVVADSFFPEGIPGPNASFKTFGSGAGQAPDSRGYELVSPSEKNNANVATPNNAGGLASEPFPRIWMAALDGESISYTSFTSFGDPLGAQGASQYLSERGADGWSTENLTPPGFVKEPLRPPFKGFTPDLGFAGVATTEPPVAPGALEGFENLYLRDNGSGTLTALTTEVPVIDPEEQDPFCPAFAGASLDGKRAFFIANGAFAGAPVGRGYSLYEWSATGGVKLVSRLPNGNPAQPSALNAFGPPGESCNVAFRMRRHAISTDGSRAFWTYLPPTGASRLMARIGGTETVQLDALQGGSGVAGSGKFWGAAADGSAVLFTDSSKLTPGASGDNDLYRYDFGGPVGAKLTNLTTADPGGAKVQGLLGYSEDASAVYFAADGVLAPGASAGKCVGDVPVSASGECNLYLWREGEGVRFISRVAGKDVLSWSDDPFKQRARVSADGRYLAFSSVLPLTGFDNLISGAPGCEENQAGLVGDPRCAEAFIYDAEEEEILCASCSQSGGRPTGPALLPAWANPYEPPHNLAEDGSRLFFSTRSPLVAGDQNEQIDVYEFERAGAGSCTEADESFVEESGGCIFLVSSGTDPEPVYLVGASTDGRDVFFSTRQRLVGWDQDERYDVYDFRAGGGFPEPVVVEPCLELGTCRPPVEPAPPAPQPGTPGFVGPGNVKPKPPKNCPKGKHKVKKNGKVRCVKNKKAKRGRGNAGKSGRAER